MTTEESTAAPGVTKNIACVRFKKFRSLCSTSEIYLPKLFGTVEEPFQVNESYFSGCRKNNRGPRRREGRRASTDINARQELEIELAVWGSIDPVKMKEMSSGFSKLTVETMQREWCDHRLYSCTKVASRFAFS